MVIKPLVGQHTAEKEDSERGMSFNWALVFTEQLKAKLVLFDQIWTEGDRTDVYGQSHNVPQSQKYG